MKLLWGKHQRNKDRQDPSRSVICWDWHSLGNCHHLCFLAVFPMRIHPRRPSCLQSFTDSLSRQAMLSLSQSQDASIEASSPLLETLNDGTGRYSRWNRKWFRELGTVQRSSTCLSSITRNISVFVLRFLSLMLDKVNNVIILITNLLISLSLIPSCISTLIFYLQILSEFHQLLM